MLLNICTHNTQNTPIFIEADIKMSKPKMKGRYVTVVNNALIPCFFFVDCLLLAGIIVLWYFMVFWEGEGFILNRPHIPCADIPHYSYPNVDTKVPDIVVYVLCFAVPPVVVSIY